MLDKTRNLVETNYKEEGARIIYGDTDSVMIQVQNNSGGTRIKDSFKLRKRIAKEVTQQFDKPITLEFEKIYSPFLLISKKRYAGLTWRNKEHYDKIECKGLEAIRRDSCLLVSEVVNKVLDKILI